MKERRPGKEPILECWDSEGQSVQATLTLAIAEGHQVVRVTGRNILFRHARDNMSVLLSFSILNVLCSLTSLKEAQGFGIVGTEKKYCGERENNLTT